jgi:putative endonuclease
MASRKNGTLYIGMTSDLARRAFEHREGALGGFTKRYGVRRLVWYESFELITAAMQRERAIEHYPRQWKINLIEAGNPDRLELYNRLNW